MLGHATRIAILAIIVGLAVVLVYERALPNTPVTDDTYLLAGLIGVIVAWVVDWLWTRFAGKDKA
ncbi:hypothetical protein SCT_1466 [Sulfuricella sp. T08]|uniref:hypothetical protein n=1 Tax=Sulfuricella sp. T08 TaxID=1632857 RepID=UPI000617A0DA|nr:hypothetical protein [Sulfuricella sp. T08]GAO36067.1 hypothetical protein SCT_1466 [Sulfuricella sp. T08]